MATLLIPSDHQQHQQQQQRRTKKAKNGQKKQPQRGLGVAQLEKLRMQEESKKVMLASSLSAAASSPSPFQSAHGVSALCYHPQLQAAVAFQQHQLQQQRNKMNLNASLTHHHHQHHTSASILQQQQFAAQILQAQQDHGHSSIDIGSSSSSRKQQQQLSSTDSGSCKSGLSSEKPLLCSSPSPSPCSSHHNKPDQGGDDGGDESSCKASAFNLPAAEPSSSSKIMNKNSNLFLSNLITKDWLLPPPPDSQMFDPTFRNRKRLQDSRDWPGVYSVPAIKELSSFQIPGNTPALSAANRNRSGCCEGPWSSSGARDGQPVKLMHGGSIASPSSFSAASSWPRSEVCFSLDGTTTKDSCSSSFNGNNNNNNNNNNSSSLCRSLEATSAKACDFLALSLSNSSKSSKSAEVDGESKLAMMIMTDEEASDETEDWNQPHKSMKLYHDHHARGKSSLALELSLKLSSPTAAAAEDDSALELKLAL